MLWLVNYRDGIYHRLKGVAMSFLTEVIINGRKMPTLRDIIPDKLPVKMLIVGKYPAIESLQSGHYFQGKQGRTVWSLLKRYGLLKVPPNTYEDEVLVDHGYAATYAIKTHKPFAVEASDEEFFICIHELESLIKRLEPVVVLFAYKDVLDRILRLRYSCKKRACFGFNTEFELMLGYKAFVLPLPGAPCSRDKVNQMMRELREVLQRLDNFNSTGRGNILSNTASLNHFLHHTK